MYGAVDFYSACKDAGIHPVIGCEAYICPDRFDKTVISREYSHLILLCENQTGYRNLTKLISAGFTEGFYYRPRLDYKLLKEHGKRFSAHFLRTIQPSGRWTRTARRKESLWSPAGSLRCFTGIRRNSLPMRWRACATPHAKPMRPHRRSPPCRPFQTVNALGWMQFALEPSPSRMPSHPLPPCGEQAYPVVPRWKAHRNCSRRFQPPQCQKA